MPETTLAPAASHRRSPGARPLIDAFGRRISYVRLSVTDRCDLRCVYCMAERQEFLPKPEVLTFEELEAIARAFVARGVRKLRLTGGEPLVRRGILDLVAALGDLLVADADEDRPGLRELTLTTNGTQLVRFAQDLADAGVRRVNVSLDTRDPDRYRALTRGGDVAQALDGIAAAQAAGLAVKINVVALRGVNEDEIADLIAWAHGAGMELTLIEVMPVGEIGVDRRDQFLSLDAVRAQLATRWRLEPLDDATGGPARYVRVVETGGRLGFITPLTENFCAGCNRVRVTCTGKLYMCLGRMNAVDLRTPLRTQGPAALDALLDAAAADKPYGHDFEVETGLVSEARRPMSMTGG